MAVRKTISSQSCHASICLERARMFHTYRNCNILIRMYSTNAFVLELQIHTVISDYRDNVSKHKICTDNLNELYNRFEVICNTTQK